jgi:hypothetical protein
MLFSIAVSRLGRTGAREKTEKAHSSFAKSAKIFAIELLAIGAQLGFADR